VDKELHISLGLPVFNGADYLERVFRNLIAQSHRAWQLLVSDNASTDDTGEICLKYAAKDSRISYHRHPTNIGATRNFDFVLQHSQCELFAWVAADDERSANFFEALVTALAQDKVAEFAFGAVENTNLAGETVRHYPTFHRFASNGGACRVAKYALSPEASGKANLIYAVYRTQFIKRVSIEYPMNESWGTDMNFVLAAVSRGALVVDEGAILYKRLSEDELAREEQYNPKDGFPLHLASSYMTNARHATSNPLHAIIVSVILILRYGRYLIANLFLRIRLKMRALLSTKPGQ
jgi:glycosyltransferase involved in cell wall biosynthesis